MSTIGAALAALVALAEAVEWSASDVEVYDGQPPATQSDTLAVGFDPDGSAVTVDLDPAGLVARTESYDVACLARAWSYGGPEDVAEVRARALSIYSEFTAALTADPSLGDAVTEARPALASVDQSLTTEGVEVTVAITVRVVAFIA